MLDANKEVVEWRRKQEEERERKKCWEFKEKNNNDT